MSNVTGMLRVTHNIFVPLLKIIGFSSLNYDLNKRFEGTEIHQNRFFSSILCALFSVIKILNCKMLTKLSNSIVI